jgi:hypothetical protein
LVASKEKTHLINSLLGGDSKTGGDVSGRSKSRFDKLKKKLEGEQKLQQLKDERAKSFMEVRQQTTHKKFKTEQDEEEPMNSVVSGKKKLAETSSFRSTKFKGMYKGEKPMIKLKVKLDNYED